MPAPRRCCAVLLALGVLAAAGGATAKPRLATATSPGTLTAPTSLRVSGSGFAARAPIVVAQCSPEALHAAQTAVSNALDYCDEHYVAVTASDGSGAFSVNARAIPVIQTASGTVDCRRTECLLGALDLGVLQGQPLQVAILALSFARSAPDTLVRAPTPAAADPIAQISLRAYRADGGSPLTIAVHRVVVLRYTGTQVVIAPAPAYQVLLAPAPSTLATAGPALSATARLAAG